MKYYGYNKFYLCRHAHIGSGLFGYDTPEAAEKAARETCAQYEDQEFVGVLQAENYNEALYMRKDIS